MNWKFGIGVALAVLGAFGCALVWFIALGAPLYIIGIVVILLSGKTWKTKLLGIFMPLLIPLIFWGLLWTGIIT
jgi:hypothetical protein